MNHSFNPDRLAERAEGRISAANRVFNFVYGWMAAGLVLSGVVAYFVAKAFESGALVPSQGLFLLAAVLEIGLVLVLSFGIKKISAGVALMLFLAYAAVNGFSLSVYLIAYTAATLQSVFLITAITFAGMALLGSLTKLDLSRIGAICGMMLWGLIVASIVNLFMRSSGLQLAISYIGVAIFVGLTAWDAQKIRRIAEDEPSLNDPMVRKLGIICALQLYLDFINLFIFLMQILGGKGRK